MTFCKYAIVFNLIKCVSVSTILILVNRVSKQFAKLSYGFLV